MNYEYKYIKYKLKYIELKNKSKKLIGGGLFPIGEILYRSAPNICNYKTCELLKKNSLVCSDTGKIGIYFADKDSILLSIAMCIEYDKLMEIGIFVVNEPISIEKDKYSFREINHDKYYNRDGTLILNILPNDEENISHYDCNITCLDKNKDALLPEEYHIELCEIFISKTFSHKIILINTLKFNVDIIKNPNDLLEYLITNNYPNNLEKYINDHILIYFDC